MQLRPYQQEAHDAIVKSWADGNRCVCACLPTGAGKTVLFSKIIEEHNGPSVAIAHRQELVAQISLSLARCDVIHKIIAPMNVVKQICKIHMLELGKTFYDPNARCAVAGVDTIRNRKEEQKYWSSSVTLVVGDEFHHFLTKNKWGDALTMFPNAKILGVTATPERADGKGLGSDFDGVVDDLYIGPTMRELICMGFLTDYKIYAPPCSDLDLSEVNVTASGDYSPSKLKTAVQKSHVFGDVVGHYLKIAPGKLGITFATDVESATEIAAKFNHAGVPSEVVSAKTPDLARAQILNKFKNRQILQLVNVDLFGEGFDLPAIEVCSMARPTQSYGLYVQQFGRALRLMEGKDWAIIIDHVGNVVRHGLPDMARNWNLARRDKRRTGPADAIPLKNCVRCAGVYHKTLKVCPYCQHEDTPQERSKIAHVDGDLQELTPSMLQALRGEIARVDRTVDDVRVECAAKFMPEVGIKRMEKLHRLRQEAQKELRDAIAWWSAWQKSAGYDIPTTQRMFYHKFHVDMATAQALNTPEAKQLTDQIKEYL